MFNELTPQSLLKFLTPVHEVTRVTYRTKSVDDSLHTAHFEPLTPGKHKRSRMFGSFERGLDKMKTILTPRRRLGSDSGPRKIKVSSRRRFITS